MNRHFHCIVCIGFLSWFLISCKSEPLLLDYCQMLKDDQSYINQDKSDMVKFNSDMAERAKIFAKNFDLLMKKTRSDGFPPAHLASSEPCRHEAIQITLIHIAQSKPELFFGKKISLTFREEIDKGNLDPELLKRASIVTVGTKDLCASMQTDIRSALNLWGLETDIMNQAQFVSCD